MANMKIRSENETIDHTFKMLAYSNYVTFKIGMGFELGKRYNANSEFIYYIYN